MLAKRRGKFITNIRAINSICPGKTNAKHKLIDVKKRTNRISVVNTIPKPYKLGHPLPKCMKQPLVQYSEQSSGLLCKKKKIKLWIISWLKEPQVIY